MCESDNYPIELIIKEDSPPINIYLNFEIMWARKEYLVKK